eukprot:4269791-Alexandrium_andersonii.AAC.1
MNLPSEALARYRQDDAEELGGVPRRRRSRCRRITGGKCGSGQALVGLRVVRVTGPGGVGPDCSAA